MLSRNSDQLSDINAAVFGARSLDVNGPVLPSAYGQTPLSRLDFELKLASLGLDRFCDDPLLQLLLSRVLQLSEEMDGRQ